MGTVVPMPLGRENPISRQCGSTEGQSESVMQNAEQLPFVVSVPLKTHWSLSQYCIRSVSDVGLSGHDMPAVRRPKAEPHSKNHVSAMRCLANPQRADEGQSESRRHERIHAPNVERGPRPPSTVA